MYENTLQPIAEVNRFEVVDHTEAGKGREFTKWVKEKFQVEYSLQDEGRTLKVFLKKIDS